MPNTNQPTEFTLGFNFDDSLVEELGALGREGRRAGRIAEVFGAMPDAPLASARPVERIPEVTWGAFTSQVSRLDDIGIAFNFLMNTSQPLRLQDAAVHRYISRLRDAGVSRFTVGTTELAALLRREFPDVHLTMSITRGVKSRAALDAVTESGCDAVYLDGVFVNRNFALLRKLIADAAVDVRLYANMSCVSACPVVRQHYDAFADQGPDTVERHDAFFAGCSLVKLRSSVEWIQMPWIRPEDVHVYRDLGVTMLKLSDRLAPTPVLMMIARSYIEGRSPEDLFGIIERSGVKYRLLDSDAVAPTAAPYSVDSQAITPDFLAHFMRGECISQDVTCPTCRQVADRAVKRDPLWATIAESVPLARLPEPLLRRAEVVEP